MDIRYQTALDKALNFIDTHYTPTAIIVSGSIIRGNPNATSDFDIYVIHNGSYKQRVQKFFDGVPCEIFINNTGHIHNHFEQDHKSNRPATAHILTTGIVVKGGDTEELKSIMELAKAYLAKPTAVTEQQLTMSRYAIATFFEDATDLKESDEATATYFLSEAVARTIEYAYLQAAVPLVRRKERIHMLQTFNPEAATMVKAYYSAPSFTERYNAAYAFVGKVVGTHGFFEWDGERE